MPSFLKICFAVCGLAAAAVADDWPGWRGATGQGQCAEKDLPLTWSPTENVRWKVALPDAGSSTPAVWGDRVFVTQASEKTVWPPKGGNGGMALARGTYAGTLAKQVLQVALQR